MVYGLDLLKIHSCQRFIDGRHILKTLINQARDDVKA